MLQHTFVKVGYVMTFFFKRKGLRTLTNIMLQVIVHCYLYPLLWYVVVPTM